MKIQFSSLSINIVWKNYSVFIFTKVVSCSWRCRCHRPKTAIIKWTCSLIPIFPSRNGHGIIGVHSPPPLKYLGSLWYQSSRSPLNLSGRTFSYFGHPHISIHVQDPLTLALLWINLIYYPLTHRFEAITLGWIKNFGITLTEIDKLGLES